MAHVFFFFNVGWKKGSERKEGDEVRKFGLPVEED